MSSGTGNSLAMLPFFPRDYLAATRHMSLAERGVYTDLLWLQWENGPLPDDAERLANMVGCQLAEFERLWQVVGRKFERTEQGLLNRRLELHREEALRLKAKRSKGASITNTRRWGSHGDSQSDSLSESHSESDCVSLKGSPPSPSPSPSPSPEDGDSFGISRPQERTVRARPDYELPEFHAQVVAVYHELVPELPGVRDWNERRRRKLNARISERKKAGKPADTVGYWRDLMGKVAASDWLMGRKGDWRCPGLEWLLESRNFGKLIEGGYDNHSAQRSASHGR
jgi:uncharacterized protein YdaU (DUF1376 family)